MKIASVNVGAAETLDDGRRATVSGINKRPVAGRVFVGSLGLAGDTICNTEHHGGADQAVYVYAASDYAWWSEQLGREVAPGTFGDNLTVDGLPPDLNAGDRLAIGNVILEATAPRIPCSTLAAQMRDRAFGLKFRRAERPGFYFRVRAEGEVAAGDTVKLIPSPGGTVSMLELFRLAYEVHPAADALRRALAAPISTRLRDSLARK